MKRNVTVSFIIPVYNISKDLPRCLESVLKQSLENYEIILVNDGSNDNSIDICKEYQAQYPFISIIDKINEGVSTARNEGLKRASGEYVCFLDGDDFYITDFAKKFYELCKLNDLDIIRGIYCTYTEENDTLNHLNLRYLSYYNQVISGAEFLKKSIDENANEVVPWLGFFKKEFLINNELNFPQGIAFEEDQYFFLKALLTKHCKTMQVDDEFYAYRVRKGSASKSPSIRKAYDVINIVKLELDFIESLDLDKKYETSARQYISSSFYQLTSIYGRVDKKERKEIKRISKDKRIMDNCLKYSSNKHQKYKIHLFFRAIWILNIVYRFKRIG